MMVSGKQFAITLGKKNDAKLICKELGYQQASRALISEEPLMIKDQAQFG